MLGRHIFNLNIVFGVASYGKKWHLVRGDKKLEAAGDGLLIDSIVNTTANNLEFTMKIRGGHTPFPFPFLFPKTP
jgi:hypothetical protein